MKEIQKKLAGIFTTVKRDNGDEFTTFTQESMRSDSELYPIYIAISTAQRESGLSFDFSYKIAELAVDILAECENWENSDQTDELIEQAVPIYTSELMEIYANDSWAVDEAIESMGGAELDSVARARVAWYYAIQGMLGAIANNLKA
jgi:hypothetical protein